jgi:type 2 lantibiotic biosynthesis protein LanM
VKNPSNLFFTSAELTKLVGDSLWFHERGKYSKFEVVENSNVDESSLLISKWKNIYGPESNGKWNKRLEWGDFSEEDIIKAISANIIVGKKELPEWTITLEEILKISLEKSLEGTIFDRYNEKIEILPQPFQEFYFPYIQIGRKRIRNTKLKSLIYMSIGSMYSLEFQLIQRLAFLFSRTLAKEFNIFRAAYDDGQVANNKKSELSNINKEIYHSFIKKMFSNKMKDLFIKYPVLARQSIMILDSWSESVIEFLDHLEKDMQSIISEFGIIEEKEMVVDIQSGLSDPHNNGRVVIEVIFKHGKTIFYKPKNLKLAVAYSNFLNWINSKNPEMQMYGANAISIDNHGWMEKIDYKLAKSEEETKNYYFRIGMMLSILYLLEASDCHHENIIAFGEFPVLIDMEYLLTPKIALDEKYAQTDQSKIYNNFWHSVLNTGLLPYWAFGPNGEAYDVSGLGGIEEYLTHYKGPVWEFVNTDDMTLKFTGSNLKIKENMPIISADSLFPYDFLDEIVNGFRSMYELFIREKDELDFENSPLIEFENIPVRYGLRPTYLYYVIIKTLYNPKNFGNGMDWSIRLDHLAKGYLTNDAERIKSWPLLEQEQSAIFNLDIPYFSTNTSNSNLELKSGEIIENLFPISSYDKTKINVQNLSLEDMNKQIHIIEGTISSQVAGVNRNRPLKSEFPLFSEWVKDEKEFSENIFLDEARIIITEIQSQAINADDGGSYWISPSYYMKADKYQFEPIGIDLYNGITGIGVFISAYQSVTRNNQKEFIDKIILPLEQKLTSGYFTDWMVDKIGIGGLSGLGSAIYSLVLISKYMKDDKYLNIANNLKELISNIESVNHNDLGVNSGNAGAILGLSALYNIDEAESTLDLINLLANSLTSAISKNNSRAMNPEALYSGFAMGTTGISYSLLLASELLNETRYRNVAEEMIGNVIGDLKLHENPVSIIQNNHSMGKLNFETSWCHGASGRGLALIRAMTILGENKFMGELNDEISKVEKSDIQFLDQLCCGNMGRIEFLLEASIFLNDSKLKYKSIEFARYIISRAKHNGSYYLFQNLPLGLRPPNLFQGLSGIGYGFLRLHNPNDISSVLLWDS